jgi:hypothetical protein
MYKILLCHRRRGRFLSGGFHRFWRQEYSQLLLDLRADLGYVRYAQLHQVCRANLLYQGIRLTRSGLVTWLLARKRGVALPDRSPDPQVASDERWDVVDELWYPSKAEMVAALTSPRGRAAAQRLTAKRSGWVRRSSIITAEEFVSTTPTPMPRRQTRTVFCLRRVDRLTREQMLSYWATSHRDLVLRLGSDLQYIGYDQLHTRSDPEMQSVIEALGGSDGAEYDGVAGLGFTNQWQLFKGLFSISTQRANLTLVGDEITFIDEPMSSLVFGEQEELYPVAAVQGSERVEDLAKPEQRRSVGVGG